MNKIKIKSIVALVLLFSLCICFIWGHARQASDYTTEQHIQRMSERIEKRFMAEDNGKRTGFEIKPLYNENGMLNIFLVDQLKSFHQSYPGIRLKIYNYSTPQALEAVRSGKVDFAVVSTPVETAGPLKVTSLASFQDILVGGRTFEHLTSRAVSLSELKKYSLMGLGQETMTYKFYNRFFMTHGQEFAPDIEVATTDQILLMVKSELGLAFVPEPMTRESLKKEEIVTIQLQEEIPIREICLVYDYQHPLNSAARQFVTMCKNC